MKGASLNDYQLKLITSNWHLKNKNSIDISAQFGIGYEIKHAKWRHNKKKTCLDPHENQFFFSYSFTSAEKN